MTGPGYIAYNTETQSELDEMDRRFWAGQYAEAEDLPAEVAADLEQE